MILWNFKREIRNLEIPPNIIYALLIFQTYSRHYLAYKLNYENNYSDERFGENLASSATHFLFSFNQVYMLILLEAIAMMWKSETVVL